MFSTLLYHLTSVMVILLSDVTAPAVEPLGSSSAFMLSTIWCSSWISGVIAVWCICGAWFNSVVSIYWCSLFTLRIMSPSVDGLLTKTQRDPFTLIKVAYNAPDTKLVFSGRGSHVTYHI